MRGVFRAFPGRSSLQAEVDSDLYRAHEVAVRDYSKQFGVPAGNEKSTYSLTCYFCHGVGGSSVGFDSYYAFTRDHHITHSRVIPSVSWKSADTLQSYDTE